MDHVTVTIRPLRTSVGKVAAFAGTMVLRYVVPAWAKAEGCVVHGAQTSSISRPRVNLLPHHEGFSLVAATVAYRLGQIAYA